MGGHRACSARTGVLAKPSARRARLSCLPGNADLQLSYCAASPTSAHLRTYEVLYYGQELRFTRWWRCCWCGRGAEAAWTSPQASRLTVRERKAPAAQPLGL